eukprot:m.34780 g.34780  ORF g.34780 m.34780 type:complete len:133 (+) comp7367_c0_seq2:1433-1831(+)
MSTLLRLRIGRSTGLGQSVRWAGAFGRKKPRAVKSMPRGPPAREAKVIKSVPMSDAMKQKLKSSTDWQHSPERYQSLTTTEKRVGMFAAISLLVGFGFFKSTAIRVREEKAERALVNNGQTPPTPTTPTGAA